MAKKAVITIESPKEFSAEEFKAIQGSELHAQMMRNRMKISYPGGGEALRKLQQYFVNWLKEHCNGHYHVAFNGSFIFVYMENDTDIVFFKMSFHGEESPVPPEVVVGTTSVPIPKPRISPTPASEKAKWEKMLWDALNEERKKKEEQNNRHKVHNSIWDDIERYGSWDSEELVKIAKKIGMR